MFPLVVHEGTTADIPGYFPNDIMLSTTGPATDNNTVAVEYVDSGTSSGRNTATTLNDTTQSWTTNEFTNDAVIITGGTGAGQIKSIASNTGTQLTINNSWDTTPDGTSTYTICVQGWCQFYFGAVARSKAFREI